MWEGGRGKRKGVGGMGEVGGGGGVGGMGEVGGVGGKGWEEGGEMAGNKAL